MRAYSWTAVLSFSLIHGSAQQLTPVWVELGEGGRAIARVVVAATRDCPPISIDGTTRSMTARLPTPAGFAPACEISIPAGAKSATVGGYSLMLPKPDPSRVVVFGDTGCRVKGPEIQDCNHPEKWPFPSVAARAAAAKPDLMIHVGDYLYREDMCPPAKQSFCGGNPSGDNWETWNADFFKPAAKLLAAVPWAFSRGNHENCERSWRGWFYYLDPHPWQGRKCEAFQAPYPIQLGKFELIMFDSSATGNDMASSQIVRYAHELASIHASHAWLVAHHPFWGFATGNSSLRPSTPGLEEAWMKGAPKGIDLVVSGHVHLFELLSFDHDLPPALVAGQGGTNLANPIAAPLIGTRLGPATVVAGTSEHQFGYTILTRAENGWRLALKNLQDRTLADCSIRGRETSCRQGER
jgi:hypothetical protein